MKPLPYDMSARLDKMEPATSGELDQSRLDHLVGYAATRASVQLKKVLVRSFSELELKPVEFSILVLVDSNEQVNQKQLGQALDLSAPNLAVILDKLQDRGLVRRVRSEQDRREQHVKLTDKGVETGRRAQEISAGMENDALRMLSGAERLLLAELLHKVARGSSARHS